MGRLPGVVVLALAVTAAQVLAASPDGAALDHFQCYEIRPPQRFDERVVHLKDAFGERDATVRKVVSVCAPADKEGEDPTAVTAPGHFVSYGIKSLAKADKVADQEIVNQLGTLHVDVLKPARLLVPSAKSLDGPPAALPAGLLDHLACYKVRRTPGSPRFQRVSRTIQTQLETVTIDIARPLRLCAPVDKNGEDPGAENPPPDVQNHLLCYRVKSTGGVSTLVYVDNQFGPQQYVISQRREFCVPSFRNPTGATSTTTSTVTTSTSTSTSTTLPCECGAVTRLRLTTNIGGGACGQLTDDGGASILGLDCGGLYFGGGSATVPLPAVVADMGLTVLRVTACSATTLTLSATTPADTGSNRTCSSLGCFFGPPLPIPNTATTPLSTCVINRITTDAVGSTVCDTGTTSVDLPLASDVYLTGDAFPAGGGVEHCVGGGNAGGICTGDVDCPDGLCSLGIQACPVCILDATSSTGSRCHGGPNDLGECTPTGSDLGPTTPTSHDCPPLGPPIGTLPIAFALSGGIVTRTGTDLPAQNRVFCGFCNDGAAPTFENPARACAANADCINAAFPVCSQRMGGAFAKASARTITEIGAAGGDLTDLAPHPGTLVSVFCIPPTFSGAIDATANLPGPGAVALSGMVQLSPGGAFLE